MYIAGHHTHKAGGSSLSLEHMQYSKYPLPILPSFTNVDVIEAKFRYVGV